MKKKITAKAEEAYQAGRRLVVPLMGFPGISLAGGSIKLAQQNYGSHFQIIKSLADRFSPDCMFPLMDLAVEANALGQFTIFPKDEAATVVEEPFDVSRIGTLSEINISFDTRMVGYAETLKLMSIGLPKEIMKGAYVIGPYTLAALLMGAEEAALATISPQKGLVRLCEFTTEIIQEYTRMLIAAGAELICILEPSAVMLGPDQFKRFSADYVGHIRNSCQFTDVGTVYHTCGNTTHLIDAMVSAGVDVLSLDSPKTGLNLAEIMKMVPEHVMVMGNICPTGHLLTGTPEQVFHEVTDLLDEMKPFPNYILSTGCDLPQETPLKNIEAFMAAGRDYRLSD